MPVYLRFVKGVIDSTDLPLNVSRELLQESRDVKAIREGSTKRVLSMLEGLADSEDAAEKDKYAAFWKEFGAVLKEGIGEDFANRERLAKLLRFASTHADDGQRVAGRLRGAHEGRPGGDLLHHRRHPGGREEQPAARDLPQEGHRGAAADRPRRRVDARRTCTSSTASRCRAWPRARSTSASCRTRPRRSRPRKRPTTFKPVLERLKEALKDRAKDVRVTTRLVDSPACLVVEEGDMSGAAGAPAEAGRAEGARRPSRSWRSTPSMRWSSGSKATRALRRPGAHPVRPGAAGRGRPAGGPGGLREARQRAAAGLSGCRRRRCQAGLPSGGSAIASSCSRSCVRLLRPSRRRCRTTGRRSGTPGRSSARAIQALWWIMRSVRSGSISAQLAPVEVHERLVAVEHVRELRAPSRARSPDSSIHRSCTAGPGARRRRGRRSAGLRRVHRTLPGWQSPCRRSVRSGAGASKARGTAASACVGERRASAGARRAARCRARAGSRGWRSP